MLTEWPSALARVLFVGRRRPALEAARALGLEVVCVDERPPGRRDSASIARFVRCRLDGSHADWSSVAAQASDQGIDAVYALTERAVVPAARIRQHLGLAGDPPIAALRSTDKLAMKRAVAAAGIPCARFVGADEEPSGDRLVAELGLPMVIKGRTGSGGRQMRVVRRRRELERLPRSGWLAESFVDGVEMSVESLVRDGRPVFTNATEYFRVRWANILPNPLAPEVLAAVSALNGRVISALGIDTAFTHLELFLTAKGPVFGEIAARPPGGHITELIERAYGFDPWQAWLRLGLGEEIEPLPAARRAAGVWLLHPGGGVVQSVRGAQEARAVPGVERLRLRARPGRRLAERVGAGQEAGHLLVTGRDRDEVAGHLIEAYGKISIEMEPEVSPPRIYRPRRSWSSSGVEPPRADPGASTP